MLRLFLALLLLAAPAPAHTDAPGRMGDKPHMVPGLELTAPVERTRPGVVKITAKVDAKEGQKVVIVWKVEGQFDDPGVELEYEPRDNNMTMQIVVPDSSGIIRVIAVATVDGKFTANRMAETYITIKYTPRNTPAAEAKTLEKAPVDANGKVTDAYFLVDPGKDVNVDAMVATVGLLNRLRGAGVTRHVLDVGSEKARRFAPYVKDAGGAPALILLTTEKKVRARVRCPATAEGVMVVVEGAK